MDAEIKVSPRWEPRPIKGSLFLSLPVALVGENINTKLIALDTVSAYEGLQYLPSFCLSSSFNFIFSKFFNDGMCIN